MLKRTFLSAFFLHVLLGTTALGQGGEVGQGAGRATITCDAAVVYSRMSTESQKLKALKRGDVVIVVLEIIGANGTWAVVKESGQHVRLGYVQGDCLEWDRPTFSTIRQLVPIGAVQAESSKTETDARTQTTRPQGLVAGDIKAEVDRAVGARLSELLRMNSSAEGAAREVVEADGYGGFFLPFVPGGFVRQRRALFVPHGGLSTALPFPLSPSPGRSPLDSFSRSGHGAAFGFQITGGGVSRLK